MLHFFSGTDREKVRREMNAAIQKLSKDADVVRISDANSEDDLRASLQGGGMFAKERALVLDGVFSNPRMGGIVEAALPALASSAEQVFLFEERVDAALRKRIEKYAKESKRFDAAKKAEAKTIFALANALRRGDKKALWVSYQRELQANAGEAIHGVLFWAAKQMLISARSASEKKTAKKHVAQLAQLPHESRRKGVELEYALEQFVLSYF